MEPREQSYDPGEGWQTCDVSEEAFDALTALVRFLALRAAGEAFAEEQQVSTSPASPPTNMESDDGQIT